MGLFSSPVVIIKGHFQFMPVKLIPQDEVVISCGGRGMVCKRQSGKMMKWYYEVRVIVEYEHL